MPAPWETYVGGFPSAATLASQNLSTAPHSTLHGNLGAALNALMVDVQTGKGSYDTFAAAFTALTSTACVNVKGSAYGAVGNGSTNDTTAINSAITAVSTSGGVVFFPPGTYNMTGITVPNNVYLLGCGEAQTTLNCTHATNPAVQFKGTWSGTSSSGHTKNAGLARMRITGGVATVGINCEDASSLHLTDFRVDGVLLGLRCYGAWDSIFDGDWRIQDCTGGIWIGSHNNDTVKGGVVDSNNLRFVGGTIESVRTYDVTITGKGADGLGSGAQKPGHVTFWSLKIESAYVRDSNRVVLEAVDGVKFDGPLMSWLAYDTSYSTPVKGVIMSDSCQNVVIDRPSFTNTATNVISTWVAFEGTDNCTLHDATWALNVAPSVAHIGFANTNRHVKFPAAGVTQATSDWTSWRPRDVTVSGVPTTIRPGSLPWSVWLSSTSSASIATANAAAINAAISDIVGFDVTASPTTVAAGSNGVNITTFTGSGTLNVVSTSGRFDPAGGRVVVVITSSSTKRVELDYTGITSTSLTGVSLPAGTGTLTTGDKVYPMPTGSGTVILPPSYGDNSLPGAPFEISDAIILPDNVQLVGQGIGKTVLKQRNGANLDAMIAGYYWWHNCNRQLTASTSANGQKYVEIKDLTLDGNHRDWESITSVGGGSDTIGAALTRFPLGSLSQVAAGDILVCEAELMSVTAVTANSTRTITGCSTTNASTTVTSANFASGDVNRYVTGTNIPADTYIVSVSAGVSAVLSNAATGTGSSITLTGYRAATVTRGAYGSTAATHAVGTAVTEVRNLSTTNARAATIVGDGHGIAIGAPNRSRIRDVQIVRPYGCGIFFDSNGRDRSTDVGEGIQWVLERIWIEFPGLDGIHNADATSGKSNINDGHVIDWYCSNANQLDVDNSTAASGNASYGNSFYGMYVYDANGGATLYRGGHGYGNYPASRTGFPGCRVKHGIRIDSAACRIESVMIADFGQATNNGTATDYYAFFIRPFNKRGPTLVGCKAHADLDNQIHTKWLLYVQSVYGAGTTAPFSVVGFNGQSRVETNNTASAAVLNAGISSSDTTIVFNTGHGLAAGDVILITDTTQSTTEVIRLGTLSTNTFSNCVRGHSQTVGQAWTTSAVIYKMTVNGLKLARQTSGAKLNGAISGCSFTGIGIPFDGSNDDASARVIQRGNSWQYLSTTPSTAGASGKHGYFPAGYRIENDMSSATTHAGWVVTTAGNGSTATWTGHNLP